MFPFIIYAVAAATLGEPTRQVEPYWPVS